MTSIIYEDIKGDDYQLLLDAALQKCNRFAFVKRKDLMADELVAMKKFRTLVKDILDSLIEVKEQSEWETAKLLESTAYVFFFELNEKTKDF